MYDFFQKYLPTCDNLPAVCSYGNQFLVAIEDRLTLANLVKAAILLFLLWVTLRIIGRVNGIKGNDAWTVQVNRVKMNSRFVPLSRGTIRRNGDPINETMKEYDERSGIVEFRIPVTYRPWLNKLGI